MSALPFPAREDDALLDAASSRPLPITLLRLTEKLELTIVPREG